MSRSAAQICFCRWERAAAGEDGETGEDALLLGREQPVRPVDRRAQRALPLGKVARAPRQEWQPLLEPREQRGKRKDLDSGSGELDRERQAVEPAADRLDLAVRRELDSGCAHALMEEGDGVRALAGAGRRTRAQPSHGVARGSSRGG